jgi:Mg2+-importing ATPase
LLPIRNGNSKETGKKEVLLEEIVPGDLIMLSAGDMIPAALQNTFTQKTICQQSVLTGESMRLRKNMRRFPML